MDAPPLKQLVDELLAAWESRDLDGLVALLDESVCWDDPAMLYGPVVGRQAVKAFCESVLMAFPDFSFRVREPLLFSASGDRCVIPWEITATHAGPFDPPGFAPTNQRVVIQGLDYVTASGGKITRIETHFNVIRAAQQALRLGAFPKKGFKKRVLVSAQRAMAFRLRRRPAGSGEPGAAPWTGRRPT